MRATRLIGAVLALAIAVIGGFEGVRTIAYRDPVGIPTICFGETRGVKMGDRKTLDECKANLGDALYEFEAGMRRCLKAPDLIPDKSYVAFLSLTYNIGIGGWCRRTNSVRGYANRFADSHNFGDLVHACDRLRLYNKAGGRVVKGLVRRREEERLLCLEGVRERTVTPPVTIDDLPKEDGEVLEAR